MPPPPPFLQPGSGGGCRRPPTAERWPRLSRPAPWRPPPLSAAGQGRASYRPTRRLAAHVTALWQRPWQGQGPLFLSSVVIRPNNELIRLLMSWSTTYVYALTVAYLHTGHGPGEHPSTTGKGGGEAAGSHDPHDVPGRRPIGRDSQTPGPPQNEAVRPEVTEDGSHMSVVMTTYTSLSVRQENTSFWNVWPAEGHDSKYIIR